MGSACPDPSELDALVAGRLEAGLRPGIEAHLDACPACASVVAAMLRLFSPSMTELPFAATAVGSRPREGADEAPEARAPLAMLGRYRLSRRLGAGAMGVVFAAHDPELDRPIAVKLLHPERSGDLDARRARLLREAQAMARLSHPHVVAVFDVGRVGDQLFLAMELVDGVTLTRWIAERRRTRAEVLDIFAQAGRGLAAAHAVGLVHRDFKPDNVLVGSDGRARVTDFGLTRPMPRDQRPEVMALELTATASGPGVLVGTPAYMAPEQLRSEPATAQADQFAFCVALSEALFGARPFDGDTLRTLADNVLAGRMRNMPSRTPRWLRIALARGLALDPAARFPSMTALLDELGRDHGRARRIAISLGAMAGGAAAIAAVLQFAVKAISEPSPASSARIGMGEAATPVRPAAAAPPAPDRTAPPAPAPPDPPALNATAPPAPAATDPLAPSATAPPSPAAPDPPALTTAAPPAPAAAQAATVRAASSADAGPGDRSRRREPAVRSTPPGRRRFPRLAAIGSINASCQIPYDPAHPGTKPGATVLDWGKVIRIEHVPAISDEYPPLEAFEIEGQRATYRTVNDFGPLGTLEHVRIGDLLALCPQGEDTLHHMAGGPMTTTFLVVPLSAPPRLGEIARFEPHHMAAGSIPDAAARGDLRAGRYLVYTQIGQADGGRFSVDRDHWQIEVAPDAPGANLIAPGKSMWLVVGDPVSAPPGDSASRVVLCVFAALDELFP